MVGRVYFHPFPVVAIRRVNDPVGHAPHTGAAVECRAADLSFVVTRRCFL